MTRRIPMKWKEIQEAIRSGIPERIVDRMALGFELDDFDRKIVRSRGKVYVESHKREGRWVNPQLRDLSDEMKINNKCVFEKIRMFKGKNYKLATLHKGVSKIVAEKTAEMNKAEGNKYRIVSECGKYATYVKKR